MDKARLEAFSDGVLAVAITLLVLDLHANPDAEPHATLAAQLRHEWPSFAAYVLSFFVIGVIWVNHHAVFALARRIDRAVMLYNLLLLLWVSTIPFTTSTLAHYLRAGGSDSRIAVLMYGAATEGMAISFALILRHLIRHDLTVQPVAQEDGKRAVRRFGVGVAVYPVTTLIGLVSATVMLMLYAVLTVFYLFEQTPILGEQTAAPSVESR